MLFVFTFTGAQWSQPRSLASILSIHCHFPCISQARLEVSSDINGCRIADCASDKERNLIATKSNRIQDFLREFARTCFK